MRAARPEPTGRATTISLPSDAQPYSAEQLQAQRLRMNFLMAPYVAAAIASLVWGDAE
jgi:hypothetical protein